MNYRKIIKIVLVIGLVVACLMLGKMEGVNQVRLEAIQAGVARLVPHPDGRVEFTWNTFNIDIIAKQK